MPRKPKMIVLVGPTASGKSSLAIQLAKLFQGEVISADSRTIYREMNIGTAKPEGEKVPAAVMTPEEVEKKGIHGARKMKIGALFAEKPYMVDGIPHWGIDLVDPNEDFTAADFKAYAEKKIQEMTKRGNVPILAGGTGLYVSAVVDNLLFTDVKANNALREELEALTNDELIERLREADPAAVETVDVANRRRLVRAIEVVETSGKPLAQQQTRGEEKYDALILGLDVDREELYERIERRVDEMIANGLVDEVRALKEKYGCEINAMTGIGYRQICAFLSGYMKLRDAVEVLKRDTRHYAKRQLTWFKRDKRIKWAKGEEAEQLVNDFLK